MLKSNNSGGDETDASTRGDPEVHTSQANRALPLIGNVLGDKRIQLPNGKVLDLSNSHAPPGAEARTATFLDAIEPFRFEACPICLTGDATVRSTPPRPRSAVK